ncbi:MAG: DivIVA domain-containing protein [Candidatus Sericytochromatia bacterium]
MQTESAPTFSRTLWGYDAAAVDAYVEALTTKQQLLVDDVESLRARLDECGEEAAALRKEVAVLRDTSPSLHAMQHRMATLLRRAVDEVSEMHAEARAEAQALMAAAKAEAEQLDVELARKRAEAQSEVDAVWQDAQQEREQLLADAKQEADHYRQKARRAVDEASQQRIKILEQLMGVYRDLEAVPATLESAYQEQENPPEEASVVMPLDQKISAG